MTAGQERYYLTLAREDYFLKGGEPPGEWMGSGASALGLPTRVSRKHLRAILAGRDPSGKTLGQLQRYKDGRSRQPGWDLTFSAPKTVSIAWALGDSKTHASISHAHANAVASTVGFLESRIAVSRRGRGGTRVEPVGLLAAAFEHGTSRAQDPQLHTHLLVANAGVRPDGTWGSIRSHDFYLEKFAIGAFYRAALAHELSNTLNYALVRRGTFFELACVPEGLATAFSTRRREIVSELERQGTSGGEASARAALSTRREKNHIPRSELLSKWQAIAEQYGYAQGQHRVSPSASPSPDPSPDASPGQDREYEQDEYANDHRNDSQSDGHGESRGKTQDAHSESSLSSQAVAANRKARREFDNLLKRILAECERSRSRTHHRLHEDLLAESLQQDPSITDDQRAGLQHLLCDSGSIVCLTGITGTGKTRLLGIAKQLWEKQGFLVRGASPTALAAERLNGQSNISSCTLSAFTRKLDPIRLGPTCVLVIDDAGLTPAAELLTIISRVLAAKAKLVLMGDGLSLRSDRERPLLTDIQKALSSPLLTTFQRHDEEWIRESVQELPQGDSREALEQLMLAERVHISADTADASATLLRDWQASLSSGRPALILGSNRLAVESLNRKAQAIRLASGHLHRERSAHHRSTRYHIGDRVVLKRGSRLDGYATGDTGTIEGIGRRASLSPVVLTIRLDRMGRAPFTGADMPIRITVPLGTLGKSAHVGLAYASTIHSAQFRVVEDAYILGEWWLRSPKMLYHALSRATGTSRVYTSQSALEFALGYSVGHAPFCAQQEQAHVPR